MLVDFRDLRLLTLQKFERRPRDVHASKATASSTAVRIHGSLIVVQIETIDSKETVYLISICI
jgi:hypothetical protein